MYTHTKHHIIEIIKENEQVQVKDLVEKLGLTAAAIHRALNKLRDDGLVDKKGTPPRVFYFLTSKSISTPHVEMSTSDQKTIDENYLYIDPTGNILKGLQGFLYWMRATKNMQKPENCIRDYIQILDEANSHKNEFGIIDATERFNKIFEKK
jgi:DNA-binding transcriptional regulator GbsR (MarR family)